MSCCDNKGELLHARCTLSNVNQYKDLKRYRCHHCYHYYQAQNKKDRLLVVLDLLTLSKQHFYPDASVTRYTCLVRQTIRVFTHLSLEEEWSRIMPKLFVVIHYILVSVSPMGFSKQIFDWLIFSQM